MGFFIPKTKKEMIQFLEILKYIVPALVVFFTAYYMMNIVLRRTLIEKKTEFALKSSKVVTPARMQAYERMILFMERISPDNMLMRTLKPKMSAKELQRTLLSEIRREFDHNLSQQLYLSDEIWETIKSAKESLVKLINSAGIKIHAEANGMELSKAILDMYTQAETPPVQAAISMLKKEFRNAFVENIR